MIVRHGFVTVGDHFSQTHTLIFLQLAGRPARTRTIAIENVAERSAITFNTVFQRRGIGCHVLGKYRQTEINGLRRGELHATTVHSLQLPEKHRKPNAQPIMKFPLSNARSKGAGNPPYLRPAEQRDMPPAALRTRARRRTSAHPRSMPSRTGQPSETAQQTGRLRSPAPARPRDRAHATPLPPAPHGAARDCLGNRQPPLPATARHAQQAARFRDAPRDARPSIHAARHHPPERCYALPYRENDRAAHPGRRTCRRSRSTAPRLQTLP